MGQYLIHNNVISDYFSENFSESAMSFIASVIDAVPVISVITQIEALSWVNKDKDKEKSVRDFVADANILMLTDDIVNKCVAIRRRRKTKTPDAIIAATAIAHDLS